MFRRLITLFAVFIFFLSACNRDNHINDSVISLKEETPPVDKLFIPETHQLGNKKIYERTHMETLLKFLTDSKSEKVEISWWEEMAYGKKKITICYSKLTGILSCEYYLPGSYTPNREKYFGKFPPDAIIKFIQSGRYDFDELNSFCRHSTYDSNYMMLKNEPIGSIPQQDSITGMVNIVDKYLRTHQDSSHMEALIKREIKYLKWTKITPFGPYWVVKVNYQIKEKYKNLGRRESIETRWFYIQNDNIVKPNGFTVKTIY